MTGLPVTAFLYEEDAPGFLASAEQLRSGFSLHLERRLRHKDGRALYTIISATPSFDDAQRCQGAFAMFTDITERKQAEAEILRLNRELEERVAQRTAALEVANREMEAFSYSVSHDLRAPLRAISGFASALEQDCGSALDDEGKRYLGLICQGASRMAHLIDDLLDLSRSSKGELAIQTVDMNALAQQVLRRIAGSGSGAEHPIYIGRSASKPWRPGPDPPGADQSLEQRHQVHVPQARGGDRSDRKNGARRKHLQRQR